MSTPPVGADTDPIDEAQKALIKAIWSCISDAASMQVVMSGKQVNDAIRAFRAAIEAEPMRLNEALRAAVAEGDRRVEALRERIHPTIRGYCPACSGGCLIAFATPTPAHDALDALDATGRTA